MDCFKRESLNAKFTIPTIHIKSQNHRGLQSGEAFIDQQKDHPEAC